MPASGWARPAGRLVMAASVLSLLVGASGGGQASAAPAPGQVNRPGASAEPAAASMRLPAAARSEKPCVVSLNASQCQSTDPHVTVDGVFTSAATEFGRSARPHLFVFNWVDGISQCYDECGFRQTWQDRCCPSAASRSSR